MKRRFTLLAIATFLSGTLMAQWDGSVAESLTITDGVCHIENESQLAKLAANVNSGTNYSGVTFIQDRDLDLGGVQDENGVWSEQQWTPIGKDATNCFKGTFNGNGFVISNLYFNNQSVSNVGLFGYVSGATITKITITNGMIFGASAVSGICGYAVSSSTISYCTNNATIYSRGEQNGGICGYLENSTITDCINFGLISGANFTGGVLGRCKDNNGKNPPVEYDNYIINSVNVGQIFSFGATSGNIVGFNDNLAATITNCYYDKQMNVLGGVTSSKAQVEPTEDQNGKFSGKLTSEMLGTNLQSALTDANWFFENGLYPRLKFKDDQTENAIILAATPILLTNNDKVDSITTNFSVSKANGVVWTSGNTDNLTIKDDGKTDIKRSTAIVLTATKGSLIKKVYIKTDKAGATKIDSLTVESEAELIDLRNAVNNYGSYKGCANYDGFKGITIKQTVNIELTDWTEPIGIHNSFKGNYLGKGKTLSGINVNQFSAGISNVGGLFGYASYGKIDNLTINGSVSGSKDAGGLCGLTFKETISNCTSNCTVTTSTNSEAGGIVGVDKGYSTFIDCKNSGNISGKSYIGGIVGRCNYGVKIIRCTNSGNITGSKQDIGGILGNIAAGINNIINGCVNNGTVTVSTKNGGGILGSQDTGLGNSDIICCINNGTISGPSIGGIIGQIGGTVTIKNCLNTGSVSGGNGIGGKANSTISNCFNAGSASNAIASSGTITNCINIGNVTTIPTNCFFDNQLLIKSGSNGKKTSEMTGDALKSALGEENWIFNTGMYPMPKGLENSDYMKLYATALVLDADDEFSAVTKNFTVGTVNSVEWTCSAPANISFANGKGYISNPDLDQTEHPGEHVEDAVVSVYVKLGAIQKSFSLTIKPTGSAVPDMAWGNAEDITITYGQPITEAMLNATISFPSNALEKGKIEYNVSVNEILNANTGGEKHTITATFVPNDGVSDLGSFTISKKIRVNPATPTIEWNPQDITYGDPESLLKTARAFDGIGNELTGTFDYEFGETVLNAGEYEHATVTFSNPNFVTTTSEEKHFEVKKANPTISWTIAPIEYGTAISDIQLGAFSTFGPISYNYKNGGIVTTGVTLEIGNYVICATVEPTNPNYRDLTIEKTLVVTKATPTISWNPSNTNLTYGAKLLKDVQLNATANVTGSFAYVYNGQNAENATPVAGDNQTISVTFTPTDQTHYNQSSAEIHINVSAATPTITWNNPENVMTITYGTALSATQLNATVSPANAGTITYSFDTNGTQNAMGGGSDLNVGTYTVYATVPASDNYERVQTSAQIKVSKATPTISWTPQNVNFGASETEITNNIKTATASCNGHTWNDPSYFTYTIPNPLNAGNQTVSVTFNLGNSNYNTVSAERGITVIETTPTITWNMPENITITYGTALSASQLNATSNSNGTITYTLGSATGNNAMNATLEVGSYTVYANVAASGNYTALSTTKTITVTQATPSITWSNPANIIYGTTLSNNQLNASANVNGTFSYSPAAGAKLEAGNNQTLSVTFTPNDTKNYTSASAQVNINVSQAEPVITWNNPANIVYGTTLSNSQLNATANVNGAFSYSPAAGAKLEAGNNQTLSVTFTPNDTKNYTSASAQVNINVSQAEPVITWNNPANIVYGTTLSDNQLNATANVNGSFSYNPAAGTKLDAGNNQTLSATFTPNDTKNYTSTSAQVKINVSQAEPVITWSNPADIAYGTTLSGTQLNATANVNGSFSYNPAAGAKLDAGNNQTLTATFTPNDTKNYTATSAQVKINVSQAEPVITWSNPTNIVYGTALSGEQLNATANVDGRFIYNPAEGATLNAGTQTLSATFIPSDTKNYSIPTAKTVTLTVSKANPVVTWENPEDIDYGTKLSEVQLNATANAQGKFNYYPIAGTTLNAGENQTLTVRFVPKDTRNYNTPDAKTVTINVNKATPTITWENPDDIVYGTILSAEQLNATADVPGKFTYSPSKGKTLEAGDNQTLTVTFTPSNTRNYNTPDAKTVTINVLKATPIITWENPDNIDYGTALSDAQLNATADVDGNFTYNPAAGTILNAGENQILTANFVPTDTKNYNIPEDQTVAINVNKITPVITWEMPDDIVFGTELSDAQLNATADVAGEFTYSPAVGTVLNAGENQTITATFTPADANNYNVPAPQSVTINVAKANPAIAWNPQGVTYGASSTEIEENIKTAVAEYGNDVLNGDFIYDIPAPLTAGKQLVNLIFSPADANFNNIKDSAEIFVAKATPSVIWENPADTVYGAELAEGIQLNASADAVGTFIYTPAPGTVLNAGENQVLEAIFTPADTANYNSVEASANINITKAILNVSVADTTITQGDMMPDFEISYYGFVGNDNEQALTAAPQATCSVSTDSVGTFEIVLVGGESKNYDFNYTNGTLTILEKIVPELPIITWAKPADIIFGTALDSTILNAEANVEGTFTYEPDFGAIMQIGKNQAIVATFVPADTIYYLTATDTTFINVNCVPMEIVWNPKAEINYGTALDSTILNAEANIEGQFTYSPDFGTILNSGKNQAIVATFVPADSANYSQVSDTTYITVNMAVPAITWKPAADSINYGTALDSTILNATTDVEGTFFFEPDFGTILNSGENQTITVTFVPADSINYLPTTDTIVITVNTCTPEIEWNSNIAYGLSLDSIYNAKTDIEGEFTFSMPKDTVLSVGEYQVVITFTPADTMNYTMVSDTATIIVVKASPAIDLDMNADFGTSIDSIFGSIINIDGTISYTLPADSVLSIGEHEVIIIFTPNDTINYASVTDTVIIRIDRATPNVKNLNIVYGENFANAFKAQVGIEGEFSYSIPTDTVLNAGTHMLAVSFTPADTTSYKTVSDTAVVTVAKATLTVTADNFEIKQGETLPELTYTFNGFVNGDNSIDTLPTVSCDATTDQPGTYTIAVSGAADKNYEFIYKEGTLTVTKKDEDTPPTTAINETVAIFEVYPNPSNGTFYVNAGDDAQEVRIFNSTGKLVKVETIEGVTRIDINEYANGMYIVRVGNQTKTIIKQ